MDRTEINIWYGEEQFFGRLGEPQLWVNIHGSITNHHNLYNLVYVLNGKKRIPLPIGPSAYRLLAAGDFNIEIDRNLLKDGTNIVTVLAKDIFGNTEEKKVIINYERGSKCPLPYYIDWNKVSSIQDAANVVDGKWILQGNGIRPEQIGYDRLVAIGDMSWKDYEATVQIKINRFNKDPLCFDLPSAGPGVGVMLRWKGHYDMNDIMPRRGYRPFGAIGWYKYGKSEAGSQEDFRLEISCGTEKALKKYRDSGDKKLTEGKIYTFKFRVESRKEKTSLYRLKVWGQDEKEPDKWDLEAEGLEGELDSGSMLMIAHQCDAIFGDTQVLPIEHK